MLFSAWSADISGRNPFVPVEAGDSVLSSVRFMRDEAKRSPVMKDDIIVNVLTPQNILSHVLQLVGDWLLFLSCFIIPHSILLPVPLLDMGVDACSTPPSPFTLPSLDG